MTDRPLDGVRVLVPRPPDRARDLVHRLREFGAEPLVCPVTRIVAIDSDDARQAIARLPGGVDWVAFASRNAVTHTVAALARAGVETNLAFAGVQTACVGEATKAALAAAGVDSDLVPQQQDGSGLATELLAAADDNPRVLLPRADNGRPELAQILRDGGATVTEAIVYRSEPVSVDQLEPLLDKLVAGGLEVAVFFAPSQVDALAAALGAGATEVLNKLCLAAIGETTAEHMRAHSLRVDLVAPSPDAQTLASALATRYALFNQGAPDAVS